MDLKIPLRKKNWIYCMIYFVLIFLFLRSKLGFPSTISYIFDVFNLILLFFVISKKTGSKNFIISRRYIVVLVSYVLFTLLIQQQSIVLFLWGLRSNYRFYIFFLACGLLLEAKDYYKLFDVLCKAVFVNALVCSYQFFVQGISKDNLGGLFGTDQGSNGYMNVLLMIASTYVVIQYLYGRKKLNYTIFLIGTASYIAVLSEIKVYFVEIVLIIAMGILLTRFSYRKLIVIIMGFLVLLAVSRGIVYFYPEWADAFSFEGLLNLATSDKGYSGMGDLNRLTAISGINERLTNNTVFNHIIGMGLGSCEYSTSFEFLTSNFFRMYSSWHYQWISLAWLYLELGYVGLILFCAFFILVIVLSSRHKTELTEEKCLLNTTKIVAGMCFLLMVYDVSLRMESAYMVYFVLAIPIALSNKHKEVKQYD